MQLDDRLAKLNQLYGRTLAVYAGSLGGWAVALLMDPSKSGSTLLVVWSFINLGIAIAAVVLAWMAHRIAHRLYLESMERFMAALAEDRS